jgi:hypothetical protein
VQQIAPDPAALRELVDALDYRAHLGWLVWLEDLDRGQGSSGLTLVVQRCGPDTYDHDRQVRVNHYFPVPPAAYVLPSWQRWLFDRLGDVDTHERMEDFVLRGLGGKPRRPYAPNHGPGHDPYMVREMGSAADAETGFRGDRDEGSQG